MVREGGLVNANASLKAAARLFRVFHCFLRPGFSFADAQLSFCKNRKKKKFVVKPDERWRFGRRPNCANGNVIGICAAAGGSIGRKKKNGNLSWSEQYVRNSRESDTAKIVKRFSNAGDKFLIRRNGLTGTCIHTPMNCVGLRA